MVTRSEAQDSSSRNARAFNSSRRRRLWRYLPLVGWTAFICFASTDVMSASNTSLIVAPLFKWLFPQMTEAQLGNIHFIVRKSAHLTEYALLALLAARAFGSSTHIRLQRGWFIAALAFVVAVALLDEYHQSFVASRTGTIRDSLIDMSGGLIALTIFLLRRRRKRRRAFTA